MRGVSRVLSALGVLLVIAGILGPIFGFDGGSFFPGIVLLFIGRVMAKQATGTGSTAGGEESTPQRVLNTVRAKTPPPPPPSPPRRQPPPARKEPEPSPTPTYRIEPEPPPKTSTKPAPAGKQRMLESLLLAGSELADQKEDGTSETGEVSGTGEVGPKPRMTSEEMIAEARKRWGHSP